MVSLADFEFLYILAILATLITCIIYGLVASFIGGLVGTRFIVLQDSCVCALNTMGAPNTVGTTKSINAAKPMGPSNTEGAPNAADTLKSTSATKIVGPSITEGALNTEGALTNVGILKTEEPPGCSEH